VFPLNTIFYTTISSILLDPLFSQIVGFVIHFMVAEKLKDLTPPIDLPLLGAIVVVFYGPASTKQVTLTFPFNHSFYFFAWDSIIQHSLKIFFASM